MNHIEPVDRNQYHLMSSLEDLVSSDHPVRIIDKLIDLIIIRNPEIFVEERATEAGRPSYSDAIKLKLILYGYFNGISSSRKLELETQRNIEVIWLLGALSPDHWTISNYRKDNGEKIKFITKKFREFLRGEGYIKLKTVVVDGGKVKAYTNRNMLTIEKIEKNLDGAEKKIEEYLNKMAESDAKDDIQEEIEADGSAEDKKKYLDKIIELQKKVEQLQKQKEILETQQRNYMGSSDPDARLMKSRDGKIPAYNVQIAVDAENKMIADSEVVTDENDIGLLAKMVESIKEELGEAPKEIIADAGYNNPDIIEGIENKEAGIEVYVSQQETSKDREVIKFEYDSQKDEYKCSEGKRLVLVRKNQRKKKSLVNRYQGVECQGCLLRSQCTGSKKGRLVDRYINQEWRDIYKKKMLSKTGKQKTGIRKTIVEHPFGTIKYWMGKIPLLLRGLKKVTTEVNIYVTAYNLKRLTNIEPYESLLEKIVKYEWKSA